MNAIMRKLQSVASLDEVLDVLEQPSTLGSVSAVAVQLPTTVPAAQAAIVRSLEAQQSVPVLGSFEVPDLRSIADSSVPVAGFKNADGDVRRVYRTADGTRIDVVQFGMSRMLKESALTISRTAGHIVSAYDAGATLRERGKRAMIAVSAAETSPQLITALVHASKSESTSLKDLLASRRSDLVRRAAVGTMTACRKLAAARVMPQSLLLEDVLVDSAQCVGLHVVSSTRLAREELVAPASIVMVLQVAAQASRVGGLELAKAFLAGALEVGNEPSWRSKTVRACAAFSQKAARADHPFSEEEMAMLASVATASLETAQGLNMIEKYAPLSLQNIDT